MIKKLHWPKEEWCGNRLCYISLFLGLEVWNSQSSMGMPLCMQGRAVTAEKILNFPFWVEKCFWV